MRKQLLKADALSALPCGSLIEDRYGDHFMREEDCPAGSDQWMSHETAVLGGKYISRHYAPFHLVIAFEPGDVLAWPESAMSVPLNTLVKSATGAVYVKIGTDSWQKQSSTDPHIVTSKELLCTNTTITVIDKEKR